MNHSLHLIELFKRFFMACITRYPFLLLFLLSPTLYSQDDNKPWERLGLSLTEWKLIQDNNMPMSKVETLLKDGIGIGEYFNKPWERLDMTETKWIAKRRSGLTSYDIELEVRGEAHNDTSMQPTPLHGNTFQEFDRSRENRELFASFFLPGYLQLHQKHNARGCVMVSLAAGSIAGCIAWSAAHGQFMPVPLLVVLVPDMVWSLIDHKVYRKSLTP